MARSPWNEELALLPPLMEKLRNHLDNHRYKEARHTAYVLISTLKQVCWYTLAAGSRIKT